ncbi:MAG: hypothetical protein EON58_09210 [Alphaproteobacteria bacterium]|nr:MAG: hypothetical protein EON58_09210 [Alphaproteobacteria bacterium]
MSGNGSNAVEELEDFVRQWILTIELANEARKNGDFKALRDTASFSYISEGGNYVNYEGYRHLERAVQAILVEGRLTLQLTPETLQRFIVEEFFVELKRAKKKGKLSTRAIIERSKARIEAIRWSDGSFVYPLVFSSRSPTSYFSVGPATLMSKQNLEEEFEAMFRKEEAGRKTASPRDFYGDWLKYTNPNSRGSGAGKSPSSSSISFA